MAVSTKTQFRKAKKLQLKLRDIAWRATLLRDKLKVACANTPVSCESAKEKMRRFENDIEEIANKIDPLQFKS